MQEFQFRNIPSVLKEEKGGFSQGVWLATISPDALPTLQELEENEIKGDRLRINLNEEDTELFLKLAQKYNGNKSLTARMVLTLLSKQPFHAGRY